MMDLRDVIVAMLNDDQLDDESTEPMKHEAIENLIDPFGWDSVWDIMFSILRDDAMAAHWRTAMYVTWGAVLDGRKLPADELIAWLYHRFDPDGQHEDNTVWSIASKLKGVSYLSEYKPLSDPAVQKHLRAIQNRGAPL